jgi:adenosylmethionine-8-amino-7-oxononanoate aminotransferase
MESQTNSSEELIKMIEGYKTRILAGEMISEDEVYSLVDINDKAARKALRDAAAEITEAKCPRTFDSCSIVNARSGSCSENCKWCAQSRHYSTGCKTYALIDREECFKTARYNNERGVKRFSLVASGRRVSGEALKQMVSILHDVKQETGMYVCASMGLLNHDELQQLWDGGINRYHCNLETAPSYFSHLCTTHTIEDKLATIREAKKIGFEVCSGGIIGMGETMRQRAELAITLRQVEPHSIPINILCPIPGTPLADSEPLTDEDILHTIAMFRFAHPTVELRFAGGRQKLSHEGQVEALRIGINSGVVGDLLTTVGSTIAQDQKLVAEAGYKF